MKWNTGFLLIFGCLAIQLFVDWGLETNLLGNRKWTSLLDPIAHCTLAAMVVLPWASRWRLAPRVFILALLCAFLIDLDHFIAAGSFSLGDAISLARRPMAHSFLFVTAAAILAGALFRDLRAFLLVLLALVSHLSRDASGGGTTPLFWPSDLSWQVPRWGHLLFWSILSLCACVSTRRGNEIALDETTGGSLN